MKSDAIKHSMYYGLILGATFILNFFLSQASGILWKIVQMFVVFSIPFLVFYITKNCRDEVNEGVMGYGAAFMYGVQLFFYASMVSSAFKYLYFKFIDPKFLKEMSAQMMSLMEQMSFPVTDEVADAMKQLFTPIGMSMQYMWLNVTIGVFVSLIVAIFVRKGKSVF
ncbi:MAG: DUF4199 domain-containing protein [Paludibacteraceae bacterium]|nr:DUF4199 domain-containing protein [Paludibacteraceae bacterium]